MYGEIKRSACASAADRGECVNDGLLRIGFIAQSLCKSCLSSGLRTLTGDVGVISFDGPGVLGVGRDNISIASLRSGVRDGCVRAGSNGLGLN